MVRQAIVNLGDRIDRNGAGIVNTEGHMALDGTEYGKAFLDDVNYFNGRVAASIIIEAQRHRKPVLFMTQALEAKISCGFPTLHYDRGAKRTLFGIPLEIVYAPGVSACWVGELVFEEELEDARDDH